MNIAVIGGGPAGMMAAIFAAKELANTGTVVLYEKNEKLGKKLYITGKGRCNLTNNVDIEDFFKNIARNSKFMYSSLYNFTNKDLMALIEEQGVKLKVERGERVFPESDKSSDILHALVNRVKSMGVRICLNSKIDRLMADDGKITGVVCDNVQYNYDAVILATGGVTYPLTGSTGDGMVFAKALNLAVIEPSPSLVPVEVLQEWVAPISGLSLKNITLTAICNGKKVFFEMGELLFTHFGVSGPLVLSASAHMDFNKECKLLIDLKPALNAQKLDDRILRDFDSNKNKQIATVLKELLPQALIPVIIQNANLDPTMHVNSITRAQRLALVEELKALPLTITKPRPIDEAIITRGGVSVKEIDPSTMSAKHVAGLYFAGELIDVDAYTGGFNLQIAFSTGALAGRFAATRLDAPRLK